ncbi:hypothetical protein [Legionella cherrii]|uniref:Uncharacterized protein n=1 Tax=Legionella cherrii TaxID=28084 RepID=A0A0W0S752_9GAMM|nr:hypothetical protein [Legionella cherrii]KTC78916.1 hypothetical protein Lche_0936 [Legionella cherrii]VEB36174.1 Uncharacterised protein [Legionella cherrii]
MPEQNISEKQPSPSREVPKLATLAAQTINKTNPHLFFTLFNNKKLPAEIENRYINPSVQKLVNEHEKVYWSNVNERKQKVDNCSSRLDSDPCYRKCASLTMAALSGGVHIGVYYILRASGVSASTTFTFLVTIPATIIVMGCFSPFAVHLLSKGIANCVIPRVPSEEVDLNEEIARIESEQSKGHLSMV